MQGFFTSIYKLFTNNKLYLVVYLLAILLFSGFFGSKLKFHEDISSIIPADKRIDQINMVLNQSKFADQIIFNFSSKDSSDVIPDSLLLYAKQISQILEADTQFVEQVMLSVAGNVYGQLHAFFYNNLPFYLSDDDYKELAERVSSEGIETSLKKGFKSLISPAGIATRKYIFKDPLNIVPFALKRLENFQVDDNFELYQSSIFTKDKKHLLVFLDPVYQASNTQQNSYLIEKIDSVLQSVIPIESKVQVEYYGGTAVAVANAKVIKTDIIYTVSIAALVLLLFFFILFRQIKVFVLMFVPVALGAGVALAFLAIFKGEISAIALGVGAVLLGISIDYSLHFFTHLRDSRSIKSQLNDLPEPIIMSSITTASAFLCLGIVKSEALNELGLFAAISVLASAFFVLTILPVLIPKKMYQAAPNKSKVTIFDRISAYAFEKNRILLAAIIILSMVFGYTSRNVGFNSDISTLNYLSDELKMAEKNLESISSETMSAVYLITSGKTIEEALAKNENLDAIFNIAKQKELYANKSSATDLILSKQKQIKQIEKWNLFWESVDKEKVKQDMISIGAKTYFKANAFSEFYSILDKEFKPVESSEFKLLKDNFLRNYVHQKDSLISLISILKVDQNNKKEFFSYFEGNSDVVLFDRQYFTNSFFEVLREEFGLLVTVSLIIVFLVLLVFFGRIELAIITFIPIILSWVWTLGLMGLFKLEFNIFNVIISTFIFGLGIDYCIFTMRGLLNDHKYGNKKLQPYRLSILLSAITTILGIGVLIFARHPALKSIALVSVFGIISVVAITYILLPLMFRYLIKTKNGDRAQAINIRSFLMSITAILIFIAESVLLLILLPFLLILPIKSKLKKKIFHFFIALAYRFLIYHNLVMKKRLINLKKLDFSNPSIIISNHQSILDLGILLMLNPKIIVLTNKWVWNSPIFGILVRYAEYYPAHLGLDGNHKQLENKVKDGYSILVFPEGTRSADGEIKRFHQGAFYLADKLNLDIQPILLHGLNHCMNKKEFFMHHGILTMKALDRFKLQKVNKGETYRKQAKEVTAMYRYELEKLSIELETPKYFSPLLINKFIYKGPVLEWYLRVKLKLEKNYAFFNKQIPYDATITDIGCGYGFLPIMLKLISKKRTILGIDYDEEKINVANHTVRNIDRISFKSGDAIELDIPKSDIFIMADVLHYMPLEKQKALIEKCMSNLNKNGKIIIRDADSDLEKRTKVTKLTEFFSTRFLRFNKTQFENLSYTSGTVIENIAKENSFTVTKHDNANKTSNITFILEKIDR